MTEPGHENHHEERDFDVRSVVWSVAGLAATCLVIAVFVWWFYGYVRRQDESQDVRRTLVAAPSPVPPEPRLQVDPSEELRTYRREQEDVLNTYAWVSRDEGRARIPIQRAMELLVERGLPTRPAAPEAQMTMHGLLIALWLFQVSTPNAVINQIGIDQQLNSQVDPDLKFVDESGKSVRLGDYFGAKPIILTPVYYSCPMLCPMALNGFVKALRVLPFLPGKEFQILSFSIDPKEGPQLASERKTEYLKDYGKPAAAAGWHFLTGSPEAVQELTREIGYRYTFDRNTNQWAHASALLVLTPDGRISQYWYGVEYDPGDLRLSLVQASNGKIGSVVDHVLLYCYQYDPSTGKYSLMIMRIVRVCGIATVLMLAVFMLTASRRNKGEEKHFPSWHRRGERA